MVKTKPLDAPAISPLPDLSRSMTTIEHLQSSVSEVTLTTETSFVTQVSSKATYKEKSGEEESEEGDGSESSRSTQLLKQEFEKKEKEFNQRIANLQREKLNTQSALKNLENDIKSKEPGNSYSGGQYLHLDDQSRRKVEQKDALISSLKEKID